MTSGLIGETRPLPPNRVGVQVEIWEKPPCPWRAGACAEQAIAQRRLEDSMSMEMKKNRLRSNTALFNPAQHTGYSLLLENEFESTRLKLLILKKFERTMLHQQENCSRQIIAELLQQNQLLANIHLQRRDINHLNQDVSLRHPSASQFPSQKLRLSEAAEAVAAEESLTKHQRNRSDTAVLATSQKKGRKHVTSGVRESCAADSLPVQTYTRISALRQSPSNQLQAFQTTSSEEWKSLQMGGTGVSISSYLRTKERRLLQKELQISLQQKRMAEESTAWDLQKKQLEGWLHAQNGLAKTLLASLKSSGCNLSKQQLEIVRRLAGEQGCSAGSE